MRIGELNAPALAACGPVANWWQRVQARPSFALARIEPFEASRAAEEAARG
jgi:hypothetical protein